jgi:hypothetical protein
MFSSPKTVSWREVGERTQDVLREYARLCAESADTAKELAVIEAGIMKDGVWVHSEEWRISTYADLRIEKKNKGGKDGFFVSVECDGQKLACECPSLARAHFFARWYRHLICYQFYSIGPNWAGAAKK